LLELSLMSNRDRDRAGRASSLEGTAARYTLRRAIVQDERLAMGDIGPCGRVLHQLRLCAAIYKQGGRDFSYGMLSLYLPDQ